MQERVSRETRQALLLCDGDELVVVHADAESRRLLGARVESIVGRPLVEIAPESQRAALRARIETGLDGADHVFVDTVCAHADGSTLQAGMHVHRIPAEPGARHAVILQAGLETGARLHPGDTPFVEFIGHLGHDFNNLLSTIIGSMGLLREERAPDFDEGDVQLLDDALSAARECTDLVDDLLASAGKQMLDPKNVDINRAAARLAELLSRTVPADVSVELALDDSLPLTRVDPDRLEAVLLNITLNARESIPHGGNIRIATSLTARDGTRCVAVSIGDDGCGISPELRERVLEPLFSTKPAGAGRGLGLSIAHGFARQSGGSLRIDGAAGGGTTVVLELPAIE